MTYLCDPFMRRVGDENLQMERKNGNAQRECPKGMPKGNGQRECPKGMPKENAQRECPKGMPKGNAKGNAQREIQITYLWFHHRKK